VIKLDPAGNVLFATYFGGNGSQTGASAICVDASGNVYLGGATSPNTVSQPDTFPVTAGAAFPNVADGGGFVAKLNSPGTALVYSTLLPVNPPALAMQRAVAMAMDPAGEVSIATTTAGALPFPTTPGSCQPAPPSYPYGSGVVAKVNASGSAIDVLLLPLLCAVPDTKDLNVAAVSGRRNSAPHCPETRTRCSSSPVAVWRTHDR